VRERVRSLIEESCAAEIVGEAATVAGALALFRDLRPETVVLDLHLADGLGFTVLEEVKRTHPACVVIVLTNFDLANCRACCRELGADFLFNKAKEFNRVPEVLAGLRAPGVAPQPASTLDARFQETPKFVPAKNTNALPNPVSTDEKHTHAHQQPRDPIANPPESHRIPSRRFHDAKIGHPASRWRRHAVLRQ
jgi:DNA-binding NarL/FixJ family response regulator